MTQPNAAAVCEKCGKAARYGIEPKCRACYWPHAMYAPNVRMARDLENALHIRFESTKQKAAQESWQPLFDSMVEIGAKSEAVTAVEVNFAFDFFSHARTLYGPYVSQVRAGVRAPARDEDDARRRVVDSLIYGGYGEEMNFAALSADGQGIPSWGPIFFQLDTQAISYRSTVLEDNSFHFVAAHGLTAETIGDRLNLLEGYLSVWDSRQKLVTSKLAPRLATLPLTVDLEGALIDPGLGRKDADYLEVHIFGPYNYQAVEEIRVLGVSLNQSINAILFEAFREIVLKVLGKPIEVI
jgi:hypothetical protein